MSDTTAKASQTKTTFVLSDEAYTVGKFIALVFLPAVATLYFALAGLWSFPHPEKVIGTITSVDTFLGILLHVSTASYNSTEPTYDGTVHVQNGTDSSTVAVSIDPEALASKDTVTLKTNVVDAPVTQAPAPVTTDATTPPVEH